jgi:hypothetical protein
MFAEAGACGNPAELGRALNHRGADRITVIQHSRPADVPTRLRKAGHTYGCSLPMAVG